VPGSAAATAAGEAAFEAIPAEATGTADEVGGSAARTFL
jgi:hypothetical protein